MRLVLDSGAFVAIDRGDRFVAARIRAAQQANLRLVTSAGVVAQVWRGGPKQALVARVLAGVRAYDIEADSARDLGVLLGQDGTADVVDAHLASLVRAGDDVMTSDPDDIGQLLATRGVTAAVRRV